MDRRTELLVAKAQQEVVSAACKYLQATHPRRDWVMGSEVVNITVAIKTTRTSLEAAIARLNAAERGVSL